MPRLDEDRKPTPSGKLLERQRRRASFSSWFMLGLGITLLIVGVYIGLGKTSSGELEGSHTGFVFKKLRGPIPALLWAPTILFCFRQFRRDRERVKELENRQNRTRIVNDYSNANMSAEDVIRLVEDGAGSKPVPEKQPSAGIVIRMERPAAREIKTIRSSARRGLPQFFKTEKPDEE